MGSSEDPWWNEGRTPLWATALTAGLLAIGFGRTRYAASSSGFEDVRGIKVYRRGRGRLAAAPSDIPALGWKDVLHRVYKNIGKDRIVVVAAGITFYSLLAIFPAIAALVALYGLFADPTTIAAHLDSLSGLLPGGALDVIRDQIQRVAAQGSGKLGLTFVAGLAISLWSANAGVKSIFDALNLVYNENEKRGLVHLHFVSMTFTAAAIVFVLIAISAVAIVPAALEYIGLEDATATLIKIVRWPVLLVGTSLMLAILYRYGPSRSRPQWRWITWGSAVAAIAWLAFSILFSWYAASFGTYNATYGSLGAVVGFMVWIWLSTVLILLGAELDAEAEHQTARDTTTGRPKPLGVRGATVADTVGAAQD